MSNILSNLLIAGGTPHALDRFELAPPGPFSFEDDNEDYQPMIFGPAPVGTREYALQEDQLRALIPGWSGPGGWPSMVAVPLEAPVRAYAFESKYHAPVAWLERAACRNPDLRFALLWADFDYDGCGHLWLQGEESPLRYFLAGKSFDHFAHSGGFWGWITDALTWVARDAPGPEMTYQVVERLWDKLY